jgi:hypothetical protein
MREAIAQLGAAIGGLAREPVLYLVECCSRTAARVTSWRAGL